MLTTEDPIQQQKSTKKQTETFSLTHLQSVGHYKLLDNESGLFMTYLPRE